MFSGLLCAAAALTVPGVASAAANTKQAMWVWDAADPDTLVAFAKAHNVSDLFVATAPTVATDGSLAHLRYLKSVAGPAGITLYALNGDPNWITNPAAALAWQKAVVGTGLFAGIHVDVEPYSLASWQTNQGGTVAAYLQLLVDLKAASRLPLEVDVPFWYGGIAVPRSAPAVAGSRTLADAVLTIADAVTVMSYRNTATGPNSIMDVGTDMLGRAQTATKPVRLAAETNATPGCTVCSFAGSNAARLQAALSEVESAASGYRTFNGMAVEDYDGWATLVATQAMWVWGAPSPDSLIAFAKGHHVSALFVEVTPKVASDGSLARLRYLKSIADPAGITLYALNGDPNWTTNPSAALTWQKAAVGTGLFAGLHVDVEPYSLASWQTNQAGTVTAYLQLLAALKAASTLPLEVDVPFWYGTVAVPPSAPGAAPGRTFADAVLAVADAVTVMSYRTIATGPNSLIGVSTDMLGRAQAAAKPIRLAAETNLTPGCAICSFAGLSAFQLQTAVNQVEASAGGYRTFRGVAIEDYKGWSVLVP